MKVQKFEAETMPQALGKVKAALGPDAVIMDTRSVRKPGPFGLGSRECVQVWAALPPGRGTEGAALRSAPGASGSTHAPAAAPSLDTGLLTALHARLSDLESKLDMLGMAAAYGAGPWARRAVFADGINDEERAAALAALARRIPVCDEPGAGARRVVALVGPSGVGKTMTCAKLAGRFALVHGAQVAVICADGFRVGAMDEMGAYCALLGVPMSPARDPHELRTALETSADRDLVLLDTAAVSPRDEQHLAELRALLQAASPDEVHLVLSAAASHAACAHAVEKFAAVGATHLVFTKLDETPDPAEALAAAVGSGRPVSYLAQGQVVPQDLHPASEERLLAVLTREAQGAGAVAARQAT